MLLGEWCGGGSSGPSRDMAISSNPVGFFLKIAHYQPFIVFVVSILLRNTTTLPMVGLGLQISDGASSCLATTFAPFSSSLPK